MREGDYTYPKTCLEIMYRGFDLEETFKSGYYKIQIDEKIVNTYCDFQRHGGGWTLVAKRSSDEGWTKDSSLLRNEEDASKPDYSIFKYVDHLKHNDPAEVCINLSQISLFRSSTLLACIYFFTIFPPW